MSKFGFGDDVIYYDNDNEYKCTVIRKDENDDYVLLQHSVPSKIIYGIPESMLRSNEDDDIFRRLKKQYQSLLKSQEEIKNYDPKLVVQTPLDTVYPGIWKLDAKVPDYLGVDHNDDMYCSCGSDNVVDAWAGGNKYKYCRACHKERL